VASVLVGAFQNDLTFLVNINSMIAYIGKLGHAAPERLAWLLFVWWWGTIGLAALLVNTLQTLKKARTESGALATTLQSREDDLRAKVEQLELSKALVKELKLQVQKLALPFEKSFLESLDDMVGTYDEETFERFVNMVMWFLQYHRSDGYDETRAVFLVVKPIHGPLEDILAFGTYFDSKNYKQVVEHVLDTPVCREVLSARKVMVFNNPDGDEVRTTDGWAIKNCGSLLLAPIITASHRGVLGVQMPSANAFDVKTDVRYAQYLSKFVQVAIKVRALRQGGSQGEKVSEQG